MNIGILIPELGGGGAERVASILGDYYTERGDKVYYFIADMNVKQDYPVKGEIINTNIKSCMSGEFYDWQRMLKLCLSSLKIRKLKTQYKIDVSISFMEEFNYLNVLSKGKEKVITRICTILSSREDLKGVLYKKVFVHFFYSNADKVVVMSQYALKDMVYHYRIPVTKIVKIPNPANCLTAQECNKAWNFGINTILCIGRLEPVKQQERIIRAFSYVRKRKCDAKLIILGKGTKLHYLKKICEKLKIEDSVIFIGFTDNVLYYLEHARVFVMASKAEGFPNSMIEAMSCGVPVITTDSPGACGEIVGKPSNIDNINSVMLCKYGILIPNMPNEKLKIDSQLTEQEVALGEAILKVLMEEQVYENYRKQSFKRAGMMSMDKVMKKWNQVIGI
ncbi:MAG: glycosyltransferase [Lachnospiraceae bacterium]|nr:glycosyltransferase [Lachnospiraceae bacterium]